MENDLLNDLEKYSRNILSDISKLYGAYLGQENNKKLQELLEPSTHFIKIETENRIDNLTNNLSNRIFQHFNEEVIKDNNIIIKVKPNYNKDEVLKSVEEKLPYYLLNYFIHTDNLNNSDDKEKKYAKFIKDGLIKTYGDNLVQEFNLPHSNEVVYTPNKKLVLEMLNMLQEVTYKRLSDEENIDKDSIMNKVNADTNLIVFNYNIRYIEQMIDLYKEKGNNVSTTLYNLYNNYLDKEEYVQIYNLLISEFKYDTIAADNYINQMYQNGTKSYANNMLTKMNLDLNKQNGSYDRIKDIIDNIFKNNINMGVSSQKGNTRIRTLGTSGFLQGTIIFAMCLISGVLIAMLLR